MSAKQQSPLRQRSGQDGLHARSFGWTEEELGDSLEMTEELKLHLRLVVCFLLNS